MLWYCLPLHSSDESKLKFPKPEPEAASPTWLGVSGKVGCSVYLVHGMGILLSKDHVHGVIQLCELEVARMLAVFLVTGIFSCFLGLLHF